MGWLASWQQLESKSFEQNRFKNQSNVGGRGLIDGNLGQILGATGHKSYRWLFRPIRGEVTEEVTSTCDFGEIRSKSY